MDLRIQKDFRQLGLCFQRATLIKQSELGISVIRTTSKDGDSARRHQKGIKHNAAAHAAPRLVERQVCNASDVRVRRNSIASARSKKNTHTWFLVSRHLAIDFYSI
jgi:hypothetical protein